LAAYVAASEAVKRAREDARPTLIECVTYRLEMHTTADDPTRYRDDEEVEKWRARDPIERFAGYLATKDLIDDDKRAALEDEIEDEIDAAWEKAAALIEGAPGPAQMFEHIYAEMTPALERQRVPFADIRKSRGEGGGDG
jgi:pyruvate dehydrogenase E1 component alpha subunit